MSVNFFSSHISGPVYIILAALRWSASKECRSSALGQPPETTSPYRTDGNIILKYKSNRAFLLKNELLFRRFSLFTKFFFTSGRWRDQESLSSIVTPKRRECFTHSIRSSPIVTEFSGPMCGFLINSIASHFAEWGVKEFSRHQLFNSEKALFKEVTVLSTVSRCNKRWCHLRT